MSTKAE
ncbi:Protein of unknown function [Streptococcus thermophilus]|nr:Protein of unknown function [Streptococcus thermophilus]